MGIHFEHLWVLLLLLPAFGYLLWSCRSTHRLAGGRKRAAYALRGLVLLLIIAVLAGLETYTVTQRRAVLFVADRSDSMADPERLADWIRQAETGKNREDELGIVSVGREAAAERRPDSRSLEGFRWTAPVNRQFTNLEAGLRAAAGLLPESAERRAVLISDGEENVGDLLRQGRLLKDRGIPVDVLHVPSERGADAAIESVRVPEKLYPGESYKLEVAVASTRAGQATLRLYEDNRELGVREVTLEKGTNRFVLQGLAKEPGFHRYRAEIYMEGDVQAANNAGAAFSRVTGPPRVLLVEGEPGTSRTIASLLEAGGVSTETAAPELLPRELAGYTAYDSIVLNNVPATRIAESQMERLEEAVRSFGVGLVMLGGENSYGLGGYYQTPIEKALPVYMDLRGKREMPSLGLVLVIDKSGSMAGENIRLAQEAASRTVNLMRENDTLGVLAFDSTPWWVVKPEKLTDKDKVTRAIRSIPADGGTEIYTAVEEAYKQLADSSAQRKHIILLTDGQSATDKSYESLTADMRKKGITLSTVAIGDGADRRLLERLAELAEGRSYFTNDMSTVPAIFSREAVLISRTYIVDRTFTPIVGQGTDWSAFWAGGVPSLDGYIAVTPKETAEVSLLSPVPDPVLARWQYGSGRTVAWTSDVSGKWSKNWVAWDRFPQVFHQIIKWTFPQFDASPFQISSRLEDGHAHLAVRSAVPDFQGELKATVTGESLESQEVELVPTMPGEYEANLPVTEPGAYLMRLDVKGAAGEDGKQGLSGSVTSGFVLPYSAEYRITEGDGGEKLARLAELTGGRVLSLERPEEVFAGEAPARREYRSLARPLLIAALLLWIADIAVRRLSLPWRRLAAAVAGRRRAEAEAAPEAAPALARLQRRLSAKDAPTGAPQESAVRALEPDAPQGGTARAAEPGVPQGSASQAAEPAAPRGSTAQDAEPGTPEEEAGSTMSRLLAARNRRRR
ncbi:VWA domain-containing protein [Paenibacillus sp. J31TS4]|uniref:VWA domain-containing protein n=1 Tax=Paenibacillus sp. J31TS4 TaxID=2807195 RepID=UPI001B268396|nr:VWA domain-containing protein [Paenibacillus sp. J31TS4]GIP39645.1 VWA domain-containing protein [Paenibacillus sp. J31TS4]